MLSVDDVTDVVSGKRVAGKQADIKEVKNAYEAYDAIMTFDPYDAKDFLRAHKLMTDGLINEPISRNEALLIDYLRDAPKATKEQIAVAVGLSRSTVTRVIQDLVARGALRRVGSNKAGFWEIAAHC